MSHSPEVKTERMVAYYQRELHYAVAELNRLRSIGNESYQIPGMEGAFERIFQTIANMFRQFRNIFINIVENVGMSITQDWQSVIRTRISRLNSSGMSDEQFEITKTMAMTVTDADRNLSAINQADALIKKLVSVACDKSNQVITQDIKRVMSSLEVCGCKLNTESPIKSSSPGWTSLAKSINIRDVGYGTTLKDCINRMFDRMPKYIDARTSIANINAISKDYDTIMRYVESETKKNPEKGEELSKLIKDRLSAIASCIKSANDLWAATLTANLVSPLDSLTLKLGFKDDLITLIVRDGKKK